MTMPEFKPIGFWNGKESAFFEHEYEGEFPPPGHSIPIHTSNQLQQAYAAGQADGKSIPMKYRRMEFNAQLQAELVAAREEIKTLQTNLRMANWERSELELIEQLAVSQADNERLREALQKVNDLMNESRGVVGSRD